MRKQLKENNEKMKKMSSSEEERVRFAFFVANCIHKKLQKGVFSINLNNYHIPILARINDDAAFETKTNKF